MDDDIGGRIVRRVVRDGGVIFFGDPVRQRKCCIMGSQILTFDEADMPDVIWIWVSHVSFPVFQGAEGFDDLKVLLEQADFDRDESYFQASRIVLNEVRKSLGA